MAHQPSVVVLAWYRPGTGPTRLLAGILEQLAADWNLDVAGIDYPGPVIDRHSARIHPTPADGDPFGAETAAGLARLRVPEAVLCFSDLWFMEHSARLLRAAAPGALLVAHPPLEGGFSNPEWARGLIGFDRVALSTSWAADEVERAWNACQVPPTDRPRLAVVPAGIDATQFRPDPELLRAGFDPVGRAVAKRRVFPGLSDPAHAFVVLNANAPTPRKRIDVTLEAFARFAQGKPHGVRLCLQHTLSTPDRDREIVAQAARLGVAERLILNPLRRDLRVPSDGELSLLYRACDVGLNTSMGESWGLVAFEHAATGAPQVVPDHSACAELWRDHAALVPSSRRFVPAFSLLEHAEVSPDAVAAVLDDLYRDPAEQARLAVAGIEYARRPGFRWEAVGRRWRELLRSHSSGAAPSRHPGTTPSRDRPGRPRGRNGERHDAPASRGPGRRPPPFADAPSRR